MPPDHHEAIVDLAIAHGVDILCEKPIADSMAASLRIARKVREAGRKMAVTMSHRFDQDKTTLRQIVRSGQLGRVNTVSCRYAADLREHMAWGALFRHTMQDPLMIEGAVHHLDLVADLAGARLRDHLRQHLETGMGGLCRRYRRHGDDDLRERRARRLRGHVDRRGRPERLEPRVCPGRLRARHRDPEQSGGGDLHALRSGAPARREGQGQKIQLISQPKWLNTWLIEKFCRWLDGGPQMETHVEANLHAAALIFAGIESQRRGEAIRIADYVGSHA